VRLTAVGAALALCTATAALDAESAARDPAWAALLHLHHGSSHIDDPRFFLAPSGATDPVAELQATVAGLRNPATCDAMAQRFPARAAWLHQRLGVPTTVCRSFAQQFAWLRRPRLLLVFPSAHVGSPSSMFGHTLLVLAADGHSGMNATAINYAARPDPHDQLTYAFKGMTGAYPGFTAIQPYWQKLGEYRDLDQRDVWEYELDLSEAEIHRVLLHIWELRDLRVDYWFFDENCASMLLRYLDTARPGLHLHRRTGAWVIPLDTVRIIAEAGLIRQVHRRPSLRAAIEAQAAVIADGGAQARAIALGQSTAAAADAPSLDLAADWLQALRYRGEVDQATYQQRLFPVLAARSRMADPSHHPEPAPVAAGPERGHRSLRLTLAGGAMGDRGFGELGLRPAYHDLADPQDGFEPGAQVTFGNVVLRQVDDGQRPVLERLEPVAVRTTVPWNTFFPSWSWHAGGALVRERGDADDTGTLTVQGAGGVGLGLALPGRNLAWVLAEGDARGWAEGAHLGVGPSLGALVRPCANLHLVADARWLRYAGDGSDHRWSASLHGTLAIHADLALTVGWTRRDAWGWLRNEALIGVMSYW
jgi:hypothetical protein